MRIIQKQISLEQFKSRMPSIVPAYDSYGKMHFFNHLVDLQNQPLVNYGMIPFNVIIQGVGEYEETQLGKYNKKEVSFSQLTNMFHILDGLLSVDLNAKCITSNVSIDTESAALYQWLINHCFPYFIFTDYTSSLEILTYWGTNKLSIQEVAYWYPKMQDLKTKCESNQDKYCCECDEYEKRGGETILSALKEWYENKIQTIICDKDDYGHDLIYNVKDEDSTVRVKVLSSDTANTITVVWHTFEIKEPRVKILGNNRYIEYGQLQKINDSETIITNTQNIEIIDGVLTIPCLFANTTYNILVTNKPYLSIPITINNSYENLGEMSSLCEEWEPGYEYNKNIENQENINYNGGVIVYYNGDNWILNDYDKPGYIYSHKFKEIYFGSQDGMTEEEFVNYNENGNGETTVSDYGDEQWERYFDYLDKYEMITQSYAYKNNTLILGPNPDLMSDKYTISTNNGRGYCIHNQTICPLFQCNYINLNDTNQYYEVFCSSNTQKQYIIIDNKKYNINFTDKCGNVINKYDISNGICYYYNDKLYIKNNGTYIKGCVTIGGITVGIKEDKILTYINNNDDGKFGQLDNTTHGYGIDWAQNEFQYFQPYIEYDGHKISGETTSKIEHLIDENHLAIDNLGIKLDGLMPYRYLGNTEYLDYDVTVKTNDWLGIPYVPKFTYGLEKIEEEENLYWGDIIDKVVISYISATTESAVTESATTLEELYTIETKLQENVSNITNIQCQVEYYIGTIISGTSPNDYQLYSDDPHEYYGVKYVDTFEISHQQFLYHNTDMDAVLVNYWKMIPHTKVYTNETYDVHNIEEQTAYFEFIIQPFTLQYGYIDYSGNSFTFYKINEYEIGEEIEIYGSMKYMRSVVDRNSQMYSAYTYYCVDEMGNKYWAEYSAESTWTIKKTEDDVYSATTNNFQDDEKGELTDTVYCLKPIKLYILHSQGTFNSHFDNIGDMTVSQVIHRENKLGFATLENINSNIYIDRGVNRVIDFHLRLLEAKSLESLEQIGNGFFKINNNSF